MNTVTALVVGGKSAGQVVTVDSGLRTCQFASRARTSASGGEYSLDVTTYHLKEAVIEGESFWYLHRNPNVTLIGVFRELNTYYHQTQQGK